MGNKCNTDKHRRRRAKEIQNKGQRIIKERDRERRQAIISADARRYQAVREEQVKLARWEFWRQDPVRYALLKRLVNILNFKVQTDPLYRMFRIQQALRRFWR